MIIRAFRLRSSEWRGAIRQSERKRAEQVGSVRVPAPRVADALTRRWDAI
jgi:hypothetical protein